MRIDLTREADDDLVGIVFYSLDTFGRQQAERYIDGLSAFIDELPDHQYRLRLIRLRAGDYWRATYKSHVVFARREETSLVIIRILHDRMDPNNYLP